MDGSTCRILEEQGINIDTVLRNNDAYHALQKTGGLIFTGPTGTNVNDVAVALTFPPSAQQIESADHPPDPGSSYR